MNARMKKLVAVVVLVFLVATAFAWLFLRRVEPVYNGKPLTFWAQQYGSNNWSGRKELAREAEFANILRASRNSARCERDVAGRPRVTHRREIPLLLALALPLLCLAPAIARAQSAPGAKPVVVLTTTLGEIEARYGAGHPVSAAMRQARPQIQQAERNVNAAMAGSPPASDR